MTRPILFAFIVVFLDAVGFGLLAPVMPSLLMEMGATDAAGAAGINKWLAVSYALMQFIFGPLLGTLSDRFGRKPVLLTSVAALSIDYVILAMAPSLWLLFVGRIIAGIAGATYATAFAVAADVSTPENKPANIGIVSAGFGLGFVLGPALGGLIGEVAGPRGPMWVAASLAALNLLGGLLFFRETAPNEPGSRVFRWHNANPLTALFKLHRMGGAVVLILAFFVFSLANAVLPLIFGFYAKAQFAWSDGYIGYALAAIGVGFAITQGIILRFALQWLGTVAVVYLAITFNTLAFTGIAAATTPERVFLSLGLLALGGMIGPPSTPLSPIQYPHQAKGLSRDLWRPRWDWRRSSHRSFTRRSLSSS